MNSDAINNAIRVIRKQLHKIEQAMDLPPVTGNATGVVNVTGSSTGTLNYPPIGSSKVLFYDL